MCDTTNIEKQTVSSGPKTPFKVVYRKQVWDYLDNNRLVNFPRPCFGRIPNFKGAKEAANKLLELDVFNSAKSVEINPDKPLEFARILTLDNAKQLYVPTPRLHEGFLKKLALNDQINVWKVVSRWGIQNASESVSFDDNIRIDLLILGSVAVSKEGYRIGKGKGFADLEFAILKEMKAVDDQTVVLTIVHDSQVFDTLPQDIFQIYDVPLDYILTPTQIIRIDKKLPKPNGIYWNLLTKRDISAMPILKTVREIHKNEERDTTLKEDNSPPNLDSNEKNINNRNKHSIRRNYKNNRTQNRESSDENKPRRTRRFFRRKNLTPKNDVSENDNLQLYYRKPRLDIDFSLLVSNIERNVRVRHLKDALIENGIKPNNITWRGYRGFCYLHYAKAANGNKESEVSDNKKSFGVDNVIEILQSLKITPESTTSLEVKIVEPITRIETTDITAV